MGLPSGFNPLNMSFEDVIKKPPVIEIPLNTSTSNSYGSWGKSHRESLWSRFNNGVASIGNWFAEKSEAVLGWISLAVTAIIIITCLVSVISTWVEEGFLTAILIAIGICIVGVISWYVAAIAIMIGVNAVMYGFRFLFWNGWTLLIAVTLALGGWVYSEYGPSSSTHYPATEEAVQTSSYGTYRCTASVLNVRIHPDKTSRVLGTLRKGQEVEVIDMENGFAAFEYKGQRGYASLRYLNKLY